MKRAPDHPLALHLYIHAVEASPHPEKADAAAERLRNLTPGLGHLVHMPTHIDVRRGRWKQAIAVNARALETDRAYRARRSEVGFYRVYMAHNRHRLAFAAMMTGQGELALRHIREMVAEMPEGWQRDNAAFADGYMGMPFEVLMRFGRWGEILAEPEPAAHFPLARALRRYARGVAFAATGKLADARREEAAFRAAKAKIPADAFFGNNSAADLMGVAEKLLPVENLDAGPAIAALRNAVAREDRLRYDEPPDWIQPIRHALGATLLRSKRPAEAEVVYREDLRRLPGKVWSLVGLARSLRLQGRDAADVEAQLAVAADQADIVLTSSCLCLPGI